MSAVLLHWAQLLLQLIYMGLKPSDCMGKFVHGRLYGLFFAVRFCFYENHSHSYLTFIVLGCCSPDVGKADGSRLFSKGNWVITLLSTSSVLSLHENIGAWVFGMWIIFFIFFCFLLPYSQILQTIVGRELGASRSKKLSTREVS